MNGVPAALDAHEGALPSTPSQGEHRWTPWIVFVLAALLFGFVHHQQDVTEFLYDARDYWQQALLQSAGPRGYLYPLLLAPARWLTAALGENTLQPYRVFSSLVYAALLTLVLPRMFIELFGGTVSLTRRLVPCLLLATVFPGVITHPVSDLPALMLCWGAVAAVQRWRDGPGDAQGGLLFGAGMLAAAAFNTRSIYLFALLPLLAVVLATGKATPLGRRAVHALVFIAGACLVTLPQVVINKQAHAIFSPNPSPGRDLFAFQLFLGLEVQRYETTIHLDGKFAGVPFIDRAGRRLMDKPGVDEERRSLGNYLGILRDYPLDMLGVYGRHLVNGLDVRDGKLYVSRQSSTRDGKSLYGFSLLALATWILLAPAAQRRPPDWQAPSPNPWLWTGILLLPVAAITPGAVETRFFLPVFILAFCTIAYKADPGALLADFRARHLRVLLAFVLALSVFSAITLTTMAQ